MCKKFLLIFDNMPNNHYLNISILSVTSLFSFISSFGFGISYITGYERDRNSLNLSAVFGSVFLCNVACLTYNYIREIMILLNLFLQKILFPKQVELVGMEIEFNNIFKL